MKRVHHLQRHLCSDSPTAAVTPHSPYILPNGSDILTPEQIKQYNELGYFVIKGLVKESELESYRQRFREVITEKSSNMTVMRDVVLAKKSKDAKIKDERQVTKIQDWQDDEVLFKYCQNPDILRYVSAFCGEDIRSIHTMLINKPPDLGVGTSRHPMHQDLLYFPLRPAERMVGVWTAMQHIDRANGCLSVIPGTHKGELRCHSLPDWEATNKAYQGISDLTDAEIGQRVYLEMEPGDTVFFHPLLIHGSGRNSTNGFRQAISCHYASTMSCSFEDIPEHNYGLIDEIFEKTPLTDVSKDEKLAIYHNAWRMKSRTVKGKFDDRWEIKF